MEWARYILICGAAGCFLWGVLIPGLRLGLRVVFRLGPPSNTTLCVCFFCVHATVDVHVCLCSVKPAHQLLLTD